MPLDEICRRALEEGRKIDLAGCNYGETDGCCRYVGRPTSYYYFLAGLARTRGLRYVLESGTHCGGSILSIYRGIGEENIGDCRLVTVDIAVKNAEVMDRHPRITRICGDSLNPEIIEKASGSFDGPIDLLYIDSLHEYAHTKECMDAYSRRLDPEFIVLDDIRLSGEMARLWREIEERFGPSALDISEMVSRRKAGFGIVRCRA